MIKLFGAKSKRVEEENKAENAQSDTPSAVRHRSAGEIRLQRDLNELDLPANMTIHFPEPENIMKFEVSLRVEEKTSLWSGARCCFTFTVPPSYPYEPPKVHCNSKIYHPNIDLQGNVCRHIQHGGWGLVLGLGTVIYSLNSLFLEPNPIDPVNQEAAEEMRNNPSQFQDNVRRSLQGEMVSGHSFPCLL